MITSLVWGQSGSAIRPPEVAEGLRVTDGSKLLFKASAKGVQIYACKPAAPDSKLFAYDAAHAQPDALLFDASGNIIIHHYFSFESGRPVWEAKDGSLVTGKKLDPVQARPGTIPWLLLEVAYREGNGVLQNATFIQRVDTEGGVAPAGSCDPEKADRVRVPYRATYYFYGK